MSGTAFAGVDSYFVLGLFCQGSVSAASWVCPRWSVVLSFWGGISRSAYDGAHSLRQFVGLARQDRGA